MSKLKNNKGVIDGTKKSVQSIEEKAENKSFFSKRNMIILVITSLVSIALVILTVLFIIDMDWNKFFINVGHGLTLPLGWLWLTILILFTSTAIVYNCLPIMIRLKRLGVKVKPFEYFLFTLSISFMRGVTPSNFIYDPYTIFWLKTQGVSTSKATSIVFSNSLNWQSIVLLIHIPSFIIVMSQASTILSQSEIGVVIIVLMSIGLFVDIFGTLLMALLCFSRRTHYFLSSVFNWFKKKLHLNYHTKAQVEQKYKERATLKNDVISFYKNVPDTIFIFLILGGYELIVYFVFNDALQLINPNGNAFAFNPLDIYNAVNMSFNANRINFLPAQVFGLEAILKDLIKIVGNVKLNGDGDLNQFVSQGTFLWRTFYTYFTTLLGLFGFATITGLQIKHYKKNKQEFIQSKYE